MAVTRWNFPDGADGNTLTAALAGADTLSLAGGTATLSDDQTFGGGSLSALMTSTGTGFLWWAKESLSTAAWAADMYLYLTTAQSAAHYLLWGGSTSSVRSAGVQVTGTARTLRLVDAVGTNLWTSSAIPLNTWVRVSLYVTCNASTGTAHAAWYLGNDTTPQDDSGLLTGRNTGAASIDRIRVGLKAASAASGAAGYAASWAYDPAPSGLIPPPAAGGVDNVKIGAAPLLGAYRGSTPVTKLYQGTNLVWTA